MSKETTILVLGIFIFFSPFLGIPNDYKKILLVLAGIMLVVIGYQLRRKVFLESFKNGEHKSVAFSESVAPPSSPAPIVTERM